MIAPIFLFRRKKKYIITLCVIYFTLVYPSPLISVFGIPPPFFSSIQSPANQSSRLRKAELKKKREREDPSSSLVTISSYSGNIHRHFPLLGTISLYFFLQSTEKSEGFQAHSASVFGKEEQKVPENASSSPPPSFCTTATF